MQLPPLTRSIGSAERSLRELLEQKLKSANLSFPEWTVLVFTNGSPMSSEQVVQREITGHVVANISNAQDSINHLISAGLISNNQNNMLVHTEKGASIFMPLSTEIEGVTRSLYGDLPIADLDATHRTLTEIAKRANNLLVR